MSRCQRIHVIASEYGLLFAAYLAARGLLPRDKALLSRIIFFFPELDFRLICGHALASSCEDELFHFVARCATSWRRDLPLRGGNARCHHHQRHRARLVARAHRGYGNRRHHRF
jgi:hypothetical protein